MSNEGPRWFEQTKGFEAKAREASAGGDTPDLFTRCPSCNELLYNESLARNDQICPLCGHHFRMAGIERIRLLIDDDVEPVFHDTDLTAIDVLQFVDSKPYQKRLDTTRRDTGRNDAYISVSARMEGLPVEIGTFDFRFLGGSMGSVVGEMITRQIERAAERGHACVIVSASGGARMQEGVLSLMQMAKTCAALNRLKSKGLPYISVLTHPTTGGVAASFAMLGDVIVAEPKALIGFAGPRVIKETIGQDLPPGFQTSEYLLANGQVDLIVSRNELKATLASLLRMFLQRPAAEPAGQTEGTLIERASAMGHEGLEKSGE